MMSYRLQPFPTSGTRESRTVSLWLNRGAVRG